jgi:hypothetical protein
MRSMAVNAKRVIVDLFEPHGHDLGRASIATWPKNCNRSSVRGLGSAPGTGPLVNDLRSEGIVDLMGPERCLVWACRVAAAV